jgi:hypothetical protein
VREMRAAVATAVAVMMRVAEEGHERLNSMAATAGEGAGERQRVVSNAERWTMMPEGR